MNLVWLRNDLRIIDNPALYHASQQGPCCCVYTITPAQWQQHNESPAKLGLIRSRLIELQKELAEKNISLQLLPLNGYEDIPDALLTLIKGIKANALFFNNEYPLNEKKRDQHVSELLTTNHIEVKRFHGDVVMPPGTIKTQQDAIYKVFTPFSRRWHQSISEQELRVLTAPKKQAGNIKNSIDELLTAQELTTHSLEDAWPQEPTYREDLWPASHKKIQSRLQRFCADKVSNYKEQRDIPSIHGTSTLSPYLAIGAVSVRQCIEQVRTYLPHWQENQWITELIWREFYRHLIDHYPHLSRSENFITTTNPIPWEDNEILFQAWCKGETGFPIVDAAMKQLQQTGWMHNRLRMVTAAFLTKLLLIDWRKGETYFMQQLIDGDYASNNGGWQWAASTGADAAPYFRIFNPERQSQRFDTEGLFIKKFIPELAGLDKKSIHTPSQLQREQCQYKQPIIDYKFARQRALDGYAKAMGKIK